MTRGAAAVVVLVSTCDLVSGGVVSGTCQPGAGGMCDDMGNLLQTRRQVKEVSPHRKDEALRWMGGKLSGWCRRKFKNVRYNPDLPNGPTLDPLTIPKYVTPLVIPPVMAKTGKDRYEIAVRQFQQQILPGGIWNNPAFANYNGGANFDFPATTVWSYGPADDEKPDSTELGGGCGVAPAANSQFNYPAFTMETVRDVPEKVDWINHLVKNPWKCDWRNPPKCRGKWRILNLWKCCYCKYIKHITPVDQSLHWANPGRLPCTGKGRSTDCMPKNSLALADPYEGPVPIVVHLHGGHVEPESDGYPEAWYLPAASNIPKGYARKGAQVNQFGAGRKTNRRPGVASFEYRNDQPSTTLWVHDHTLGMTRNNVYAGPAGFYLIRLANGSEDGLEDGMILPYPAPKAGETLEETNLPPSRNKYREIPIVIQDRSFNDDGSLFYPKDRAFFHNLRPDQLKIPLMGSWVRQTDVHPIWNPEAFFDTIVVNGVTWPLMEVEPDLYRFRLLNGCNSRVLNLIMYTLDADGNQAEEVPFYVIGTDQSLLPKVVMVTKGSAVEMEGDGTIPDPDPQDDGEGLLMGPAYRFDVLVDFSDFAEGTIIQVVNTAPDSPFGGTFDEPANSQTTGQVMRFRVIADDVTHGEDATHPAWLRLTPVDTNNGAVAVTRDQAVMEFESSKVCVLPQVILNGNASAEDQDEAEPSTGNSQAQAEKVVAGGDPVTIELTQDAGAIVWDPTVMPVGPGQCENQDGENPNNSEPFGPLWAGLGEISFEPFQAQGYHWDHVITTNPALGDEEQWAFWDTTEDAHPIHMHLVKFHVVGRREFDPETGALGDWAYQRPTYNGWKDTVLVYPGYVTYVVATFDIPGLFVWHCHMLEHEDNEMMLPYCVGDVNTAPGCAAANSRAMP